MAEKQNNYHIVLEPKTGWFDFDLKEVWQYKDLIIQNTKRSFTVRYKQTVLGPAWLFITPIITSLIYLFVFGGIAGIPTDGVPQMLFYLGGNAIWSFFSSCLTGTSSTFTGNAAVFGKVYFPRLTMPISTVLSSVITFGIQMILFLAIWVFYIVTGAVHPHYEALLLLPVVLLQLGLLGLGLGIIISSVTTKYRDLTVLVGFGVSLWMYITPVVYPMSTLGEGGLKTVICANPVTSAVELFRYMFLGQGMIDPFWWTVTAIVTIAVVFFGIIIFSRVEKTFMDTV